MAKLSVCEEGIEILERARIEKDWNKHDRRWYEKAFTSKSTLRRFWNGENISSDIFKRICEAVDIEDWKVIAGLNSESKNQEIQLNKQEAEIEIKTWQRERFYGQFIGRNEELQELLKYLESDEKNKVLGIVGIVGIGGLGKTALCHQLVLRACEAKLFSQIAWVRARVYQYQTDFSGQLQPLRDSRLTLEDALKDIGQELKLPSWVLQDSRRRQSEIIKVLNSTPHLIIIDGLEDAESPKELATELRSFLGKSCLIITSRQSSDSDIFEYKLHKFNKEVSREFIEVIAKEKYSENQNPITQATDSEIEAILNITDGMPLAMKLLISRLKNLELDRIIERIENVSEEQKLYNYLFEDSWIELERENATKAQQLLVNLSSRFRPIPIKFLYGLGGLSKQDVDEALQKLAKLSLVDISPGLTDKRVSLHSFTARYFGETLRNRYQQMSQSQENQG